MNLEESSNGISPDDLNTSDRRLATDIFFSLLQGLACPLPRQTKYFFRILKDSIRKPMSPFDSHIPVQRVLRLLDLEILFRGDPVGHPGRCDRVRTTVSLLTQFPRTKKPGFRILKARPKKFSLLPPRKGMFFQLRDMEQP
jgi:hypothetical protein